MRIVSDKRDFWLLELQCTITETINEEKPVWPSCFLKSFDSRVRRIVDYSFAFWLSTWVV
jgi:hypothetical protein